MIGILKHQLFLFFNSILLTIFLYNRLCTEVTNKQTAKTNLNLADYVRVNHISLLKKDMTTNPQLQSNKKYDFLCIEVNFIL